MTKIMGCGPTFLPRFLGGRPTQKDSKKSSETTDDVGRPSQLSAVVRRVVRGLEFLRLERMQIIEVKSSVIARILDS